GAQSGSETRLRVFFQRRNVPVATQVPIPGVGHVDLLVGQSLIVEADSQAHHSRPRNVAADRERDLTGRQLGFRSLRLSYEQIWHTWERTQRALATELRLRHHRKPPRPL